MGFPRLFWDRRDSAQYAADHEKVWLKLTPIVLNSGRCNIRKDGTSRSKPKKPVSRAD